MGNTDVNLIKIIEVTFAISSILFYLLVLYMLIKKASSKAFLTIIKIELVFASIIKAAFYLFFNVKSGSTACKIQVVIYEFSSFSCLLLGTTIPLIIYINLTRPGIIDKNQSKFHWTIIVICWLIPIGLAILLFTLSDIGNDATDTNCEITDNYCIIIDISLNFLIFLFMLILFCKIQRTLKQSYNNDESDLVLKEYLSHFSKYIFLIVLCLVYIIAYTVSDLIFEKFNIQSETTKTIVQIMQIIIELLMPPCFVFVFTFKPEMLHCCSSKKRESLNSKLLGRQESAMFEMERTNQSISSIAEL